MSNAIRSDNPDLPSDQSPYPKLILDESGGWAETVSKLIIEKILSRIVSTEFSSNADKKFGEHCFNYVKNIVTPLISTKFMCYELEDKECDNVKLFYNNQQIGESMWVEIPEPGLQTIDRCDNTKIKITKSFAFDELYERNQKHEDTHSILNHGKSDVKSSEDNANWNKKQAKSKAIPTKLKTEKNEENEKEKQVEELRKKLQIQKQKQKAKAKERENNQSNVEVDLTPVLEIPSYDWPNHIWKACMIKDDNTPDLNYWRSERELFLRKKEELRIWEEEKKKKEFANNLSKRYTKEFDGAHYTFDPNGEVLMVRPQGLDNIRSNEFYWSKAVIRDKSKYNTIDVNYKGDHTLDSVFESDLLETEWNNIKNRTSTNRWYNWSINDKAGNNVNSHWKTLHKTKTIAPPNPKKKAQGNNKTKGSSSKKPGPKQIRHSIAGNYIVHRKSIIGKLEENIIYNPLINDPFNNYKHRIINQDPIMPSGANFEIIRPEIGVVVTSDNNRKKEGGVNYVNKYNKPSMNEFSKFVFQSANTTSLNSLMRTVESSENWIESNRTEVQKNVSIEESTANIINDDKPDYMGYIKEFHKNNNPWTQNAHYVPNVSDINDINKSAKSYMSNQTSRYSRYLKNYKTEMLGSIKLGKKNTNLRIMVQDDLLGNNDYLTMNSNLELMKSGNQDNIKNVNLFKKQTLRIQKVSNPGLEVVDKFNYQILNKNKDQRWGRENGVGQSHVFKRPAKANHFKELGLRLVTSSRLPRQRKEIQVMSHLHNNEQN